MEKAEQRMSQAQLYKAFIVYANFGASTGSRKKDMESRNFKKMLQTSRLLGKGRLNMAELDMIFTRTRGPIRNLSWNNFHTKAVPQVAQGRNFNFYLKKSFNRNKSKKEKKFDQFCKELYTVNDPPSSDCAEKGKKTDCAQTIDPTFP